MEPSDNGGCPFKRADKADKRLKLLIYGEPGTGKTITSLSMPKPVVIDMEKGTQLYGGDFEFDVLPASTPDEVRDAVDWLLSNKHDYRTLIIDPITIYWSAQQDKWNDIFKLRKQTGAGFKFEFYEFQPRDWMTLKAEGKALLRMLSRLDMNVVCTAHRKDLLDKNMSKTGTTYDGMKGIDYFFDVVLELSKDSKGKFMGNIVKDRTNTFPEGTFPMSYPVIEKAMGTEILTREATPIPYATADQRDKLETYFVMFTMEPKAIKKMLARWDTNSMDELTEETATELLAKFDEKHETKKKQEGDNA
jgi:hypothetical protein